MDGIDVAEQSGALVVIGGRSLTAQDVFVADKGVDAVIAKVKHEVANTPGADISTPTGRQVIRSTAYKIARTKSLLDDLGKNLVADLKKQTGAVDADRRRIRDELDALQEDFRRPLTIFEDAERSRVEAHEAAIREIEGYGGFQGPASAATFADKLNSTRLLNHNRDWQEFAARAATVRETAMANLTGLLEEAIAREAAEEEAERQRQEEAARQQREREAAIAARAAEEAKREAERKAAQAAAETAERARRQQEAAEEKARQEREAIEATARADAEAARKEQERIEKEKAEALAAAQRERDRAEEHRVKAHEFALQSIKGIIADACSPMNSSDMIRGISKIMEAMHEMTRDWEEFHDRATAVIAEGRQRIATRLADVEAYEEERRRKRAAEAEAERIAAEQRAEQERQAAAEKAERDRLQAIEDERARVAAEEDAIRAATAAREADRKHKAKVHREARDAIRAVLNERPLVGVIEEAEAIVIAIAGGLIPGVRISY